MKPDLLICWLKHTDYPLFRHTLKTYRSFFGKVIIYFSEHNRFPYYDHFIQDALSGLDITFLDPTFTDWNAGEDWRNHATNEMLKYSKSEWVCSVEQDWFAKDWTKMLWATRDAMERSDMTGWMNHSRAPYIHPGYWFMKRELLEKTNKDFSPHSEIDGCDHFGMTTYDAQRLGAKIISLQDLGFKADLANFENTDCYHQGGINVNYLNFDDRLRDNSLHRVDLFYQYNYWSMKADVVQSPHFMETMQYVDKKLRGNFPNPEESEWRKFFI